MKLFSILLLSLFVLPFSISAQSDDIPVDESLIVSLYKVANGGYLSKTEVSKAKTLAVNEKEAVIIGFEYICEKPGQEANIHNDGPELNDQIISHMKSLKIGSKIIFENIRIENSSGEVLSKPVKITIKS